MFLGKISKDGEDLFDPPNNDLKVDILFIGISHYSEDIIVRIL